MEMNTLWLSFRAFNINAFNNMIYTFQSNGWFALIAICAVVLTMVSLREELTYVVTEEQNIV